MRELIWFSRGLFLFCVSLSLVPAFACLQICLPVPTATSGFLCCCIVSSRSLLFGDGTHAESNCDSRLTVFSCRFQPSLVLGWYCLFFLIFLSLAVAGEVATSASLRNVWLVPLSHGDCCSFWYGGNCCVQSSWAASSEVVMIFPVRLMILLV